MSPATVPLDTMVPISRLSRGGASKEFAKVEDGVPVTILKNNEPAYIVITPNDYSTFRRHEIELENLTARNQALSGEGEVFGSIEELMADLHA